MLAIPSVTLPRLRHGHAGQFGPEPVLDQAGNVLVGATALIMEEDGVTPVTIYADRDRTAIADNPIPVGQAGKVRFFANPGVHVLRIVHQGVTVQETTIVVPVDPEDALRQPEVALLADDFGCVPDGRFLERASIEAGSAVLIDNDGTLRAADVGKSIAIPGAADLVATIAGLLEQKDVARASMNAGGNILTASFGDLDREGFRASIHQGQRITVVGAGPQGTPLVTDVVRVVNATTLELLGPASTTVTDAKAILNDPTRVRLSDYARRSVEGVTIDLGDRTINDGSMTVGASEEGLASQTARFSFPDLDKRVTIRAAGLLVTSVESFESPTRVTLAAPAERTVEEGQADIWNTDSRPGLERLLASLKERDVEAVEIRFGPGVYDFTRTPAPSRVEGAISLHNLKNLTIRGSGVGATVLRLMPHQDLGNGLHTHVIETQDCANLTLRDLSVHGAYLTMGKVNEQMHGILLNPGSQEIVVERVRVFQTAGDGIRFVGEPPKLVRKVLVDGCRFIQNKRTGVMFQRGAEHVWVRNCYIEMTPPSTDACIDFEPSPGSHPGPADIVIDSNLMVHGNATVAVSLSGIPPAMQSGVDPARRIKFSNNIVFGGPVFCSDVDQLTVQNNVVVVTALPARRRPIIRIPLEVQRGGNSVLIAGNILVNEEVADPSVVKSEAVISLNEVNQRPVKQAMVTGNLCFAGSGSGIQLRSCVDVAVEGNMVVATGSCTQGIFVRSQSSNVDNVSIRNNDVTVEAPGSWTSGIFLGATLPHEIHHVSVVGNAITGATIGIEFVGEGFRQTPLCALNRMGAAVTNPLDGLGLLPQTSIVVGGAASHGGSGAGTGAGRSLVGHGGPEGKVPGNAGDIYQRVDTQAGPRLFVKESDAQPTTGWVAK